MVYSFVEQVQAFPERIVVVQTGQQQQQQQQQPIVDWAVAWQGRQHGVSGLLAASGLPHVLQEHDLHSLKMQVFNSASDAWDENGFTASSRTTASIHSAAGLSITATFDISSIPLNNSKRRSAVERVLKTKFRQVLVSLFSERWILGSLESVHNERLHRFLHVDWQNFVSIENDEGDSLTRVPVVLWLPHEAFSLSAEGIHAFLVKLYPCGAASDVGVLATHSATEWSNLLLGYHRQQQQQDVSKSNRRNAVNKNAVSSLPQGGRRGLWVEVAPDKYNEKQGKSSYRLDMGLQWRIRTKGSTVSWSNLLGDTPSTSTTATLFRQCPLADSAQFTVLDNPDLPEIKSTSCSGRTPNDSNALHKPCIDISKDGTESKTSSSNLLEKNDFHVQANLRRTRGPGHGGRVEMIVNNRHESCAAARVKIWHVIPPILKPLWGSFDSSLSSSFSLDAIQTTKMIRPQRRWKDDGTLELTLDINMTSDSVLRYAFDYDPLFLSIESFPGDPNRGFEMPPVRVVVEPLCSSTTGGQSFELFSESLLFLSPLPDASMPFNVLSLSCTLVAFVIGSILNLVVRRVSEKIKYTLHPELQPKSKIQKIKEYIQKKIQAMRGIENEKESDEKEKGD